ncbi:hypothetical protein ACFWQC_27075 [Nocardioides sp. NPDC058538]|uniref:hypothetical protein n=1 Tax=Nocardioides sp. NPDC058538 TaxID=3346542 RepID=UPI00365EE0F3
MPDTTDQTSEETSGLVDDLATVLEETGVHVEELIEELLEAVDLAETIAAALQHGEPGEVDAYAATRAQAARAISAGLAAAGAALRGAWDAVPGQQPAPSGAGER